MRCLSSAVLLALFLAATASGGPGGNSHERPYVTYPDKDHALSDTTVFSVLIDGKAFSSRILSVDGEKFHCTNGSCPFWVRTLPGTHNFKVFYQLFARGFHDYGEAQLLIREMKPRHIYEARFHLVDKGDKFFVTAEDLGENPEYGLKLGLTRKFHRVEF